MSLEGKLNFPTFFNELIQIDFKLIKNDLSFKKQA
jgi:hypothetical protein